MNSRELHACADRLEEFLVTMLASVGRSERRHHGSLYVQGLLLDGERKSIEPLAERLPGGNVQALQQFVGQSPWAWEPVRCLLAQHLEEELLPLAGWIIDDTGFPKQGHESVGVARQYSGTLGKVGNCQVAVGVHLTTEAESMPLDWALYLPQAWTEDAERCRKAGIPEKTSFRTKIELALELIDHLLAWKLSRQPVLADAGYGNNTEFRQGLADRQLHYVVGVESNTAVWEEPTQRVQPRPRAGRGRPRRPYYRGKPRDLRDLATTPAGRGLAYAHLETGPSRSTTRSVCCLSGAACSRSCSRQARVGAGLAVDGVAVGSGSPHQVLVLEPPRGRLPTALGTLGETPLASGTELSAAQRGVGAGPLRRTRLAGLASSRDLGWFGLCLSAAGEATLQKKLQFRPCLRHADVYSWS